MASRTVMDEQHFGEIEYPRGPGSRAHPRLYADVAKCD
jgi:hypothetical protein